MPTRRMLRAVLVGLLVGLVLLPQSPALAGQSVDPATLTPPPPSFESCQADGANIICRGSIAPHAYGPSDNQIFCGTGATAFDTFDSGVERLNAVRYYDQTGNLVRQVIHFDVDGQWSNALTGTAVPYTQHNSITDVLAVPGDFSSTTETQTGNNVFTLPHDGALAVDTGRFTIAPDGSVDLVSARHDIQAFFLGDTGALQKLCVALGA